MNRSATEQRSRPRLSRFVPGMFVLFAASCGEVTFVDPFAAEKARLQLVEAERLIVEGDPRVYVLVRVGSRNLKLADLQLTLSGPDGMFTLPLEDAITQDCGERESCISITLGPGLPNALMSAELAAPRFGHHSRTELSTVHLGPYAISSRSISGNTRIVVDVDDPIRAHLPFPETSEAEASTSAPVLFPRTFEALVRPGACSTAAAPDAKDWTRLEGNPSETQASFSSEVDPRACVSVRPSLPRGGPSVASATVEARALVTRFSHVYSPKVELSPMVFIPFFDLEIANETRCQEAENLVTSAILDTARERSASSSGGAEVLALDAIELAHGGGERCHQTNDRTFDPETVGGEIRRAITRAFGESRRVRVLLVYATNLEVDPPAALSTAFVRLRKGLLSSEGRGDYLLTLAPSRAVMGLMPDQQVPWLTVTDAAFRELIQGVLRPIWPFTTILHTDQTAVPLTDASMRARFSLFRICSATKTVLPIGSRAGQQGFFIPGPLGPAYTVSLEPSILSPAASTRVPAVAVEWEGCEGLCDHPASVGDVLTPWNRTEACP